MWGQPELAIYVFLAEHRAVFLIKKNVKDVGMACKKYANKVGMMHKSKGHVLAKPHPYIFAMKALLVVGKLHAVMSVNFVLKLR